MSKDSIAPKNCTECYKNKTCRSWYGGCGCTEAPMTIFGPQKRKMRIKTKLFLILAASFLLCTSAYAEDGLSAEDAMSIILDHHNVQTDIDISNYLTLNAKTMTREVAVTAVIRSFGVYPADEPDYVWDDEAEQGAVYRP